MNKTLKYIVIGIGIFVLLLILLNSVNNEYVSKLEAIALAITTGLIVYPIANNSEALRSLQQEYDSKKESDRKTIYELQEQNRCLQDQIRRFEEEKKKTVRQAIYNEILKHIDSFNEYSADELTEIVMRNLSYVKIRSIEDIKADAFHKTIKIALCAELGLLDLYQNSFGTPGRMAVDGSFVNLSNEEYAMLIEDDYNFIVDSIDELPHVSIE